VHPVRLEREHLSLSVAAMPDVSEGDLLGMLAFLSFGNRYSRAIVMWEDDAARRRRFNPRCGRNADLRAHRHLAYRTQQKAV
jgi:hypothetical protein